MRTAPVLAALAIATGATAQSLPSVGGYNISTTCQQALVGLLSNETYACFQTQTLSQLITANTSIIPILDEFMSGLCYSQPCTNATLTSAATAISTGCATDFAGAGVNATDVQTLFGFYPLARELLCTKTSDPYTAASYGGFLGEPPIPIDGTTYNSTDGTFCVTSVLTQLSAYFGANLTVAWIGSAIDGTNQTAIDLINNIQANILCNDCLFGAFDIINVALPTLGNTTLSQIGAIISASPNSTMMAPPAPPAGNATTPAPSDDPTLIQIVDGVCAYVPLNVTSDGTLPPNITVSIVNSTFPYPIMSGSNMTANTTA